MSSDHDEIRNALAVYCHAFEDGEYERLAEIFQDYTISELTGGPHRGVDAAVAAPRTSLGDEPRKRRLMNSHITEGGPSATVVSDWCSLDRTYAGYSFAKAARWLDEFERLDGRWYIIHRRFERC